MLNPSHLHNAIILSYIDDGGRSGEEEEVTTTTTTVVEESPKPEPTTPECTLPFFLSLVIVIVLGIGFLLKKAKVW